MFVHSFKRLTERDKVMKKLLILTMAMITAVVFAAAPVKAAPGERDLPDEYKLTYAIEEGNLNDQFQVKLDNTGIVEVIYPFISGGPIKINELQVQSAEAGDNGVTILNLLWNCDQGRPSKAFIPMRLQAGLELPERGKYLIRLWKYEAGSEKTQLLREQKIEWQ